MKKPHLVIIALVGIAISGTAGMVYLNSLQQVCIDGRLPNGLCNGAKNIGGERTVETVGLSPTYGEKQPIEFTLLAHGFDGCEQIRVQVFDESKDRTKPAIYDDAIRVDDCRNSPSVQLREYSFPVKIPLSAPPGKYFLLITHAHTRTDIRIAEQSFEITHMSAIEGTVGSTLKKFNRTIDAGANGLFEISGTVDGARVSGMVFSNITNEIDVNLEDSGGGHMTISIPRKLLNPRIGDMQDSFIILANSIEIAYNETVNDAERTLTIEFPAQTKEIKIVGTFPLSGENPIAAKTVLRVSGTAPCAWMSVDQLPHDELLKRYRGGAYSLTLNVSSDDIDRDPQIGQLLDAFNDKTGFRQSKYEKNTWEKSIPMSEEEQQKVWQWLKDTFVLQYGKRSDDSSTTFFTYDEKYYQINWALC